MRLRLAVAAAIALVGSFIGTAIAGRGQALEREVLVRARVWCEAVESRDALRYQETFRRGYFRGTFDRFSNIYTEPTEDEILGQMPDRSTCEIAGDFRGPGERGDVYVPVTVGDDRVELRMRREAGFYVVYQLVSR